MATASPSLLINSIQGRLGSFVFYYSRGTQCVRTYVIPRNPDTQAQRIVRRNFAEAVHTWQSMTSDQKYAFNRKARYLNMSGYNLFISGYIKTNIRSLLANNTTSEYDMSAATAASFSPIHSVSNPYLKANSLHTAKNKKKPPSG